VSGSGRPGARIVAVARSWIGTPYRHQGACRGAGADCLGLVRGVWCEVYGQEPEVVPAYTPDWSEPEGKERLWQAAARHLLAKDLAAEDVGDVILFRMAHGAVAKHLGIVSQTGAGGAFIHAYSRHAVVESPLSAPWARRIVARFEFPKI